MTTSVAMCTYNGEKYLREQLETIINQTIKIDEIIICDDISTDNTISIIKEYQEKYPNLIKLFINENNLRSVKNFEKAISLCENELIFLSDQDDLWKENKVEIILNYYENNKEINAICTNYNVMDENSIVDEYKFTLCDVINDIKTETNYFNPIEILIFSSNFATGCTMAFKKSLVEKIIPIPIIKDYHHDEWIALLSSLENKFDFLNEKLINYRIHIDQQVGGVSFSDNKKKYKEVKNHFYFINTNTKMNFKSYKVLLKKLVFNYNKVKLLNGHPIKNEILLLIEEKYNNIKKEFFLKYPISSKILHIFDKLNNKRILKKC